MCYRAQYDTSKTGCQRSASSPIESSKSNTTQAFLLGEYFSNPAPDVLLSSATHTTRPNSANTPPTSNTSRGSSTNWCRPRRGWSGPVGTPRTTRRSRQGGGTSATCKKTDADSRDSSGSTKRIASCTPRCDSGSLTGDGRQLCFPTCWRCHNWH